MTIKNSLLLILLFFAQTICFSNSVMYLEDKAENYEQTETGYVVNFSLNATQNELTSINQGVEKLSDRLTLTTNTLSNNMYKCVLVVDHQNQPEYVHKMLLSIGIDSLNYKGENFQLIKIIEILKSYL